VSGPCPHVATSSEGTSYCRLAESRNGPHRRDWAVHPGAILVEHLHEIGMTETSLAGQCGYTLKHISQVINGHKRVTAHFALAVEHVTGIPAHVLVRIQADYDVWQASRTGRTR
jgi:addiction module HigA family antidote